MRKLLAFLLALGMIISMVIMPAAAETQPSLEVTAPGEDCPCGCGKTLSQVEWEPWNINEVGAAEGGHYYLQEDYLQSKQYTIPATKTIVLDLRGNALTAAQDARLFFVYGFLAAVDTVGGGQYLNACVWFETLTGQSVLGNTYVPTYTYGGVTYGLNEGIDVETLQKAAHQAVAEYRAEEEK